MRCNSDVRGLTPCRIAAAAGVAAAVLDVIELCPSSEPEKSEAMFLAAPKRLAPRAFLAITQILLANSLGHDDLPLGACSLVDHFRDLADRGSSLFIFAGVNDLALPLDTSGSARLALLLLALDDFTRRKLPKPLRFIQQVGADHAFPSSVADGATFVQQRSASITMRKDEDGALNGSDRAGEHGTLCGWMREEKSGCAGHLRCGGCRIDVVVEVDEKRVA